MHIFHCSNVHLSADWRASTHVHTFQTLVDGCRPMSGTVRTDRPTSRQTESDSSRCEIVCSVRCAPPLAFICFPLPVVHSRPPRSLVFTSVWNPSLRTTQCFLASISHRQVCGLPSSDILALQKAWLLPRSPLQWALWAALPSRLVTFCSGFTPAFDVQYDPLSRFCLFLVFVVLPLPSFVLFQVDFVGCDASLWHLSALFERMPGRLCQRTSNRPPRHRFRHPGVLP